MDRSLIIYVGSAAILAVVIIFISINLYTSYMTVSSGRKFIAGYPSKYAENAHKNIEVNRLPVLLIYLKYTVYTDADMIVINVNNITVHYENGQVITYSDRGLEKSIDIKLGGTALIASIPLYPGRVDKIYVNIVVNKNEKTLIRTLSMNIELDRVYEVKLTL